MSSGRGKSGLGAARAAVQGWAWSLLGEYLKSNPCFTLASLMEKFSTA